MQWWTRESIASKLKKIRDFLNGPGLLLKGERVRGQEGKEASNPLASSFPLLLGMCIWTCIIVMWVLSLSAPQFHPENIRRTADKSQPPTLSHPFGADEQGRDVMALVIAGSIAYLLPGLLSVVIALSLGALLGSLGGYFAGQNRLDIVPATKGRDRKVKAKPEAQASPRFSLLAFHRDGMAKIQRILSSFLSAIDPVINYLLNLIDSLPQLALIFIICAVFSPNIYLIVAILGLMNATKVASLIRSKILSLKKEQFIEAARELSVSPLKIVLRHLLWYNCRPIFLSGAAHTFADVILFETTLRYIWNVVGAKNSWGELLVASKNLIFTKRPPPMMETDIMPIIGDEIKYIHLWWVWFFPALAIVLTILGSHLLGDALIARLEERRELY